MLDLDYQLLVKIGLYLCLGLLTAEFVTNLQKRRYNATPPKSWYMLYALLWPFVVVIGAISFACGAIREIKKRL